MTDANELCDTVARELKDVVICDSVDTEEEQQSFSSHPEKVSDDIPPSLLSYFETSKSRAMVCEKFILEDLEDVTTSHYTEDMRHLPYELCTDMMKLNEQVSGETENEETSSSSCTHLPIASTETEALIHSLSVSPINEDEAETVEHMGSETYEEGELKTLMSSMKEEQTKKKSSESLEQRRRGEEMEKEEKRRQRQRDFQEQLKKIVEAEKLHQRELELMEKRAQEKLEQEFRLQQEMISDLQKRVKEEREMWEEEQRRMKEEGEKKRKEEEEKRKKMEEDRRKRDEETIKKEKERKRKEEERRKQKEDEEERKIEEMRLREKERRTEVEKKKRQDEKNKWQENMKKEEEKKTEETRLKEKQKKTEELKRAMEKNEKRSLEEEKWKREEEKNKIQEDMKRKEEERKIEEMRLKEKQWNIVEEKKEREEDEKRRIEEEKIKSQSNEEKNNILKDVRKKEEERKIEERGLKEEEESGQIEEEEIKRKESEKINRKGEPKETRIMENITTTNKTGEDKGMKCAEEIRLKERRKKEKEEDKDEEELSLIKTPEMRTRQEEIRQKEQVRKSEEETKKVGVRTMVFEHMKVKREETRETEEKHLKDDKESPKKEEEKTIKGEEQWWQKGEKEYSNTEEEIRLETEEEWNKANEAENRKLEDERKTTTEDECQEEVERRQEEDVVRESEGGRINLEEDKWQFRRKEENIKVEERRLTKEEERNNVIVRDSVEKEESPSFYTESTSRSTKSDTVQRHDPINAVSQTSLYLPESHHDAADKPCSSSPACLPEHTEHRRLSWMTDCISWATLSVRNKSKQTGRVRSRREVRRAAEAGTLPPLCPLTLLQSTGCQSLQEVTTVTLEKLPGCSLSILSQCTHLQSLTLRRCGLRALEGINQLAQLCHIDVQENDISFLDCENMTGLRVLRLGHNKLKSIHGLSGADNLDVLDLSHNSITRVAGLESMRRLQRLSLDHNQLISTKGLRDVYTLLHLDCSHNHLACVEGLENNALLQTLDLRSNCLSEPPSLNNHVLLRELQLDDNSISSLQGLALCWLPLMHHFSASRNRITLLPSMSDFVSLANLDLRFNCLSELQNVCECVEGCQFLREIYLTGNPLQGESGWRSMLQKAVTGLRAIDGEETDSCLSAPAVRQGSLASGSFLMFCQAQLKQTRDLQQQHSRELSDAASHLNAVRSSCQHFTETLKLAVEQRFAHEYGDTLVSAGQTTPRETLDVDSGCVETLDEHSQMASTERVPKCIQSRTSIIDWASRERTSAESGHDALDSATAVLKTAFHHLDMATVSNHPDLDSKNSAAVVIQQWWRKYRQKCGNISAPPTAQKGGGDGGKSESGPSYVERNVVGQDYAATVIQAFWRGFSLRRRLASALATVTCPDSGEDETFEEVDVDGFVLDEASLEKYWTLPLFEDSSFRQQPRSLKPARPFPEPFLYTPPSTPSGRPKQEWVAGEQADPPVQRTLSQSSTRSNSPASPSVLSGLSARSQRILEEWGFNNSNTALLMLKRAQKMKSKTQQQRKHMVCKVELGLQQQREQTKKVKQERAQQWLPMRSDRGSESEHFLPEISSDVLNGGRVQLVADPGHAEHPHHGSGLWASRSLAVQPSKERNYLRRDSLGHARKEVPSPKRVASAPTKKERISFRDNPVQLSGGWGGGKKRNKVHM